MVSKENASYTAVLHLGQYLDTSGNSKCEALAINNGGGEIHKSRSDGDTMHREAVINVQSIRRNKYLGEMILILKKTAKLKDIWHRKCLASSADYYRIR